jgi:hypothetical protein
MQRIPRRPRCLRSCEVARNDKVNLALAARLNIVPSQLS